MPIIASFNEFTKQQKAWQKEPGPRAQNESLFKEFWYLTK
jgi:hypothetical protein